MHAAGRYVAGVEFAPVPSLAQWEEQVAYVPLVAPAPGGDDAPRDSSCRWPDDADGAAGPALLETTALRHFRASHMTNGVHVGAMPLQSSALAPPPAGLPLDPDLVTAHLGVRAADTPLSMAPVLPRDVSAAAQRQELPALVAGVCYRFELTFWDYGGGLQPVADLVPWLTHTMHLALMPVRSLWTLDHLHALVRLSFLFLQAGGGTALPHAHAGTSAKLRVWGSQAEER